MSFFLAILMNVLLSGTTTDYLKGGKSTPIGHPSGKPNVVNTGSQNIQAGIDSAR